MKVGFLLFDEVEELDFAGPLEVFGITSRVTKKVDVMTVSKDGRQIRGTHGLKVEPDFSFTNCPPLDLLIVPGGKGARVHALRDKETLSFVRLQASRAEIASVCTGALLLAEAGILDGHEATTHHELLESLQRYPRVKVIRGIRYVREGRISTSAGVSAGIDLALAIVRDMFGDAVATEVADEMEYESANP